MTEISCEMCMDLMPLVHDGVASADSVEAVKRHIRSCPQCRGLFEGQLPEPSGRDLLLRRLQREAKTFCAMVLMFGIFCCVNMVFLTLVPVTVERSVSSSSRYFRIASKSPFAA